MATPEELYRFVAEAGSAGEWQQAFELLLDLEAEYPGYADVPMLLQTYRSLGYVSRRSGAGEAETARGWGGRVSRHHLHFETGPKAGQSFSIGSEPVTVGRHLDNAVALDDVELSRRHARLEVWDGEVVVMDLGSTNGTFVNGEQVDKPRPVKQGDRIMFGTIAAVLLGSSPDQASVVPTERRVSANGSSRPGDGAGVPAVGPESAAVSTGENWLEQAAQERPERAGVAATAPPPDVSPIVAQATDRDRGRQAAQRTTALEGQELGQYRIVEPLGEGGFARVYLGVHTKIKLKVAIKVLHQVLLVDDGEKSRFLKEAEIAAKIGGQHHIVTIHDYDERDGLAYFVMEYVPGRTLKQRLLEHPGRPSSVPLVREVTAAIGDALDFAHEHRVLHRDVKPANVLLGVDGRIVLADFGVAVLQEGAAPSGWSIIGTPAYMSPEQAQGRSLDRRCDVYGFAVMLYEMLTGRPPYVADTPVALMNMHVYRPLPLPRELNPALPEEVEWILLRGLAKNPDDRYGSAGELTSDLLGVLSTGPAGDDEERAVAVGRRLRATVQQRAWPTLARLGDELRDWAFERQALPPPVAAPQPAAALPATAPAVDTEATGAFQVAVAPGYAGAVPPSPYAAPPPTAPGSFAPSVPPAAAAPAGFQSAPPAARPEGAPPMPESPPSSGNLFGRLFSRGGSPPPPPAPSSTGPAAPPSQPVGASPGDAPSPSGPAPTSPDAITDQTPIEPLRELVRLERAEAMVAASASYDAESRGYEGSAALAGAASSPRRYVGPLFGHADWVLAVTYSTDGRWLASGSKDQSVRLWDTATGETVRVLEGHTNRVGAVAFSPNGRWLASGSYDRTIRIWDPVSGLLARTLPSHERSVYSVAFDPTGRRLASGSEDGRIRLWDVESGTLIAEYGGGDPINSVAFSSDGALLASGAESGELTLWDSATGRRLATGRADESWVNCVAFDPTRPRLASAGGEGAIRLWELGDYLAEASPSASGTAAPAREALFAFPAGELLGHVGAVWSVAFAPGGDLLASASEDRSVRLWDLTRGESRAMLEGHTDGVRSVAFAPDGRAVASGANDGSIRIWTVER
ncbi:MAG: protein kinase [Chloroflexi bacterium]|nr:protein kinase [Chloroflexota bacterium]